MSKILLKKTLMDMEKEQIIDLLLDAYSARKETKEFLEFFINPDVEKLLAKYELSISKEFKRFKHGSYSKARISLIKKLIKEFSSFQPGFQAEIELLFHTVSCAMTAESYLYFPETLIKGISSVVNMIVDIADKNIVADKNILRLKAMFSNPSSGTRHFRGYLNNSLDSYLAMSKPTIPPIKHSLN